MKKMSLNRIIRVSDASLDDIFDDSVSDWQLKAERLIKRRERKMRHQMMQS